MDKKIVNDHTQEFETVIINNSMELMSTLNDLIKQGKTPDIIIIDLFHKEDIVERARKLFPDVPIVMYTEQGLSIVGVDESQKVSSMINEWMQKGQHRWIRCFDQFSIGISENG